MSTKTPAKSKSTQKTLVLLDAHAIIHRAYHALPEFANSKGEPTGALFGVCTILLKIIDELKPDYIVACFDLPEPTHRHEAYDQYKAGRRKTDDALSTQLERAKDLFRAWGIPIYSCPGFEADDIIGTIVEETLLDKNLNVIIASGDMDTLQLVVKKKVQVYMPKKSINDTMLYDEEGVVARFQFGPKLLPDYKGLRGDPSDNIIGVKGIGEKTATALITTFGTVENIYKNLKKSGPRLAEALAKAGITERVAKLLLDNEEEAIFSKTLATIRVDAPINFSLPDPWKVCLNMDTLLAFFNELEFRTMGERVKMVLNSVGPRNSDFLTRPGRAQAGIGIPQSDYDNTDVPENIPEDKELTLALWVVDSNIAYPTMEDVFRFTKAKTTADAWKVINVELDKRNARRVFDEIERPLVPVVEEMNSCGVKIDRKELERLSKEYHKTLAELEQSIWKDAGQEFNIGSPTQLGEILFTKLDLGEKRQKKTSTGKLSTKESELVKLAEKHPIINKILEYRELAKLLSTYIDSIPKQLDDNDRLHSTFILAGTTTGRMASQNPNLQNIPIKSSLGRAIRKAFIAEKGHSLLSLDYSQIELRIAAILSKDMKLVDIFKRGEDVHTGVAAQMFHVDAKDVDKEMRRKAKTINFGILYGMGVNALKTNLNTDRSTAQEFYNNYFSTFSELASYLDSVKAETERRGYTETMFGRRRYFSGFKSPLPFIRAQAERMAINAPIQGTEADIVKIAMRKINDLIVKKGWHLPAGRQGRAVSLILNVHDEIVYEVKDSLLEETGPAFKKIMEEVIPKEGTLGVPIIAEFGTGKNWGDSH
jgi:DNA polymerase-1